MPVFVQLLQLTFRSVTDMGSLFIGEKKDFVVSLSFNQLNLYQYLVINSCNRFNQASKAHFKE